jgi:hypothetical protein
VSLVLEVMCQRTIGSLPCQGMFSLVSHLGYYMTSTYLFSNADAAKTLAKKCFILKWKKFWFDWTDMINLLRSKQHLHDCVSNQKIKKIKQKKRKTHHLTTNIKGWRTSMFTSCSKSYRKSRFGWISFKHHFCLEK